MHTAPVFLLIFFSNSKGLIPKVSFSISHNSIGELERVTATAVPKKVFVGIIIFLQLVVPQAV